MEVPALRTLVASCFLGALPPVDLRAVCTQGIEVRDCTQMLVLKHRPRGRAAKAHLLGTSHCWMSVQRKALAVWQELLNTRCLAEQGARHASLVSMTKYDWYVQPVTHYVACVRPAPRGKCRAVCLALSPP
jgi:hypothetical protein